MRFNPYSQSMKKSLSRKSRKSMVLRVLGWSFVLIIVALPSVLHSYYGIGISPVLSSSMQPAANPGDAFITIDQDASTLKVGDIVTLRAENTDTFFAHRIIEIREQSGLLRIVTKGDSNQLSEEDPYMVAGNVEVPKTIFKVKWIGHALVYLTSVQGRESALSLIVLANIIALMLFLFRKKIQETVTRAELVYKDLFRESRESQEIARRRADTYKDLYEQSRRELQSIKEHEYAESNK